VQALVRPGNLSSFTLEELGQYLTALDTPPPSEGTPTPEPLPLAATLAQADWVIFNLIDLAPGTLAEQVFTALLSQRLDMVRGKKIIVFDYGAPYYLDATDLTKLTAVYALYSDAPAFVDAAAQLLFRELTPLGDPPVSVPGINYNLIDIIAPDPGQSLQLFSDKEQTKAGDTLQLATGQIVDRNGRPVPDGTRARFLVK
jgi:beta-N-acetylhexosaminidase